MTVSSVDYSKDLERMRRQYDHMSKEQKKISEMERKRLTEMQESTQKKSLDKFTEQKTNLENDFNNRLHQIKETTQGEIEGAHKEYAGELNDMRGSFEDQRLTQQKEFDRRLGLVSNSFKNSEKYSLDEKNSLLKEMRKGFRQSLDSMNSGRQKEIDLIQDRAKEIELRTQDRKNEEIDRLVKLQQDRVQDLLSSENERRLNILSTKDGQINSLDNMLKDERENHLDRQERLLTDYKKKSDRVIQNMRDNFQSMTDTQREKNLDNLDRERIASIREKQDLDRMNAKEKSSLRKNIELAKSEQALGENAEFREIENEKRGMKRRIDLYRDEIDNLSKDFYAKNERVRESYLDDLKDTRKKLDNEKSGKVSELRDTFYNHLDGIKNDRDKAIKFHSDRNNKQRDYYEGEILKGNKLNQKKSQQNVLEFNQKIEHLSNRNNKELGRIKDEFEIKQKENTLKLQKEKNDIMVEMKKEYEDKIQQKDNAFFERMSQKDNQLMELQEKLEDQMNAFKNNSLRNDRYKDILHQAKYDGQFESMKETIQDQNKEFAKRIDSMRENYDKKIETLHKDYAKKIKGIIIGFQDTANQLQVEKMQEVKKVERLAEIEKKRLKDEQLTELDRAENRYQNKLEQLKSSYEGKIEKLQDSNKEKNQSTINEE